jgi:PAS domain S-box-containing protein
MGHGETPTCRPHAVGLPKRLGVLCEFRAILQHVKIPSALVDRNGIYVWANDAFVATFGEVCGRSVMAMVPPASRAEVGRQLAPRLEGEKVTEYEADALLDDGRRVRAEVSSVRIDSSLLGAAIFGISIPRARTSAPRCRTRLTPRQFEVLQFLADGASTEQIAAELHLSLHTVRNFVRQILQSLRVHSRLEAVVKARREGLVDD